MDLRRNIIDSSEYNFLISKNVLTNDEILRVTTYPHASLSSYCKNLTLYDIRKIHNLEDFNIINLFRLMSIILGNGSKEDIEIFRSNLKYEPLRSAILLAQQEDNETDRYISFCINACRALLSAERILIASFIKK